MTGVDVEGAEPLRGDRENPADLVRLSRVGPWDAVIDTSASVPRVVLSCARVLTERVDRYLLISTVSVYSEWPHRGVSETSQVRECAPDVGPGPAAVYGTYGTLKAGCERAVDQWFSGRAVVLRPTVILGPHENIGRLPWWLHRMRRGGRVLAPGAPERTIQPVDVRDVAAFALHCLETGTTGTFNVAAPKARATYGELLQSCVQVTGTDADLVWVPDEFLVERNVEQWTELPLWRTAPGTWDVTADGAARAGLVCRSLGETVRDTWMWLRTGGAPLELPAGHIRREEHGIDSSKERDLLSAWDSAARPKSHGAPAGESLPPPLTPPA
jgi:nucleoside-diphosphate-sugar epimerase